MTTEALPIGPDPEAITRTILEIWPETDVVEALGAWFFSRDAEKHWPNFATIVTTDEHDIEASSNLEVRGAYRLNIGVGRETFERLTDPTRTYDYEATDVVLPHPTYA